MDLYTFLTKEKEGIPLTIECYDRIAQAVNGQCPQVRSIATLPNDFRAGFGLACVPGKAIYITGGKGKTIACYGGDSP